MLTSFEEAVKGICSNSFMRITIKNFDRYEPFRKDYVTCKYGKLPCDDVQVLESLTTAQYGAFIRIVSLAIPTKTNRFTSRVRELLRDTGLRLYMLKDFMHVYYEHGLVDVIVCPYSTARPSKKLALVKSIPEETKSSLPQFVAQNQSIFSTERASVQRTCNESAMKVQRKRSDDALRKDLTDLIEKKNSSNLYGSRTESVQQIKTKTELIKTPYISPGVVGDNLDPIMTYDSMRKEFVRTDDFQNVVITYIGRVRIWHEWKNQSENYPTEDEIREQLGPMLRVVYEYGYRGLTLAEWKSPEKARKVLRQRIIDTCGKHSVTNWNFPETLNEAVQPLFEKFAMEKNQHA